MSTEFLEFSHFRYARLHVYLYHYNQFFVSKSQVLFTEVASNMSMLVS